MAMPTSAIASAGASFIPSPTIATFAPSFASFSITILFSSGNTSAITSSIPTLFATYLAVSELSPLKSTTLIFIFLSSLTAYAASSLRVSATASTPTAFELTAIKTTLLPCSAYSWAFKANCDEVKLSLTSLMSAAFPKYTLSLPIFAKTPFPDKTCISFAMTSVSSIPSATAYAIGCSLIVSTALAYARYF